MMRAAIQRLISMFRRDRLDRELDEEVQAHLDALGSEFERRGLSREEARMAARRSFGNVESMKERHRDRRGLPWLDVLLQDVRFAWRQLKRRPGAAVVSMSILGVSIGATVAVCTVVRSVLIQPLAYPAADRLVAFHTRVPQSGRIPVSNRQFQVWNGALRSFDGIALLWGYRANLAGVGEPERVAAALVSPALFRLLDVEPQLGRVLRDDEGQPGRDRVVMLSDQLWRSHFNTDRNIVGATISVDGVPHEVVGVLPRSFRFPRMSQLYSIPLDADRPDLWKPLGLRENDALSGLNFAAFGRLQRGVSRQQAQAELDTLQAALSKTPGEAGLPAELTGLQDQITGSFRRGLELLLGAVGAVLLIACANVTNVVLARSAARQREFDVRTAVGATRRRIAGQLFTEGVVLAASGGVFGVLLAALAVRLLIVSAPIDLPRLDEVRIDAGFFEMAAIVTLAAAIVVGLFPAWRLPRHVRPGLTQSSLVVGQVCATAVCAIVAGLLLQSFIAVLTIDKGFEAGRIMTANFNLAGESYTGRRVPIQRAILERIERIPGVTGVALSSEQLLSGTGRNLRVLAEGATVPLLDRPLANFRIVNPDFFHTFGIALQRGQVFSDTDTRPVAVVSASLATRLWPAQNAVGKRFRRGPDDSPPIEVVGVAGDVRASTLEQPAGLIAYVPFWQMPTSQVSLAVKAIVEPANLASAIRDAIRTVDPRLPLAGVRTMDAVVADALGERRFLTSLVLLFAMAAVMLAAVGIYGIVSQGVAQRAPEIGLRVALGARGSQVRLMVLRDVWKLVGIGLTAGVWLVIGIGSALKSVLFNVLPNDAGTIVAACLVLAGAATLAGYIPARRAASVNPIVALRSE